MELIAAIFVPLLFVVGAVFRRWMALVVPLLLWALWVLSGAIGGGLGSGDYTWWGSVLVITILILVPGLVVTAVGILVGRAVASHRGPKQRAS